MKLDNSTLILYKIIKELKSFEISTLYSLNGNSYNFKNKNTFYAKLNQILLDVFARDKDDDNPSPFLKLIDDSYLQSVYNQFVRKFETTFKSIKTGKIQEYRNIKILSNLINLDESERRFLNMIYTLNHQFDYCDNSIYSCLLRNNNRIKKIIGEVFGITTSNLERIGHGNSILSKSNIILLSEEHVYPNFVINPKFLQLIDSEVLNEKLIREILFPSKITTELTLSDYHQQDDIKIMCDLIESAIENKTTGINILLWGEPGTGKTELAQLLSEKYKWKMQIIGDSDSESPNLEAGRKIRLASLKIGQNIFEKSNQKNVLLFDEAEDVTHKLDANDEFSKSYLNKLIDTTPVPIIWTTNNIYFADRAFLRRMSFSVKFDVPPKKHREHIWKKYNNKYDLKLDNETIEDLSDSYDVVPSVIDNAARIVQAGKLDISGTKRVINNLDTVMNNGIERKMDNKKSKITPYFDINLVNSSFDMNEFTNKLINCKSLNFSLCLHGPSGTGKSEYGRYIAQQLKLNVLYKKASDLMSMWVGMTEKNIAAAFEQARDEGLLLIFDEADSFLMDRSSARNSWEVTSVNEMLTQMESHTYPFVCTTNLMDRLDAASLRRFTFKMKFDFLKPDQIESAFRTYFNGTPLKQLRNSDIVTLGDFGNTKKRTEILGITDEVEISKMILDDLELKPQFTKKIGY